MGVCVSVCLCVCLSVCLSVCMVSSDKLSRVFGSLLLTECSVACYFLSVQIDILCAGELLGKDHTLKFILVTRWRAKVRLPVCLSASHFLCQVFSSNALAALLPFSTDESWKVANSRWIFLSNVKALEISWPLFQPTAWRKLELLAQSTSIAQFCASFPSFLKLMYRLFLWCWLMLLVNVVGAFQQLNVCE